MFIRFKPQPPSDAAPITTADASSIHAIEIKQADGILRLNKSSDQWLVSGTLTLPADEYRVKEILRLLSLPSDTQYAASEVDLAELGLDPATTLVTFNDVDVALGATHPLDQKRYVLVDNTVHLVDSFQVPTLTVESSELVSKKLIQQVSALIRIDTGDYLLEKQEGSRGPR